MSDAPSFKPVRVLCHRQRARRDWYAWFESDPAGGCLGSSPEAAVSRLIDRNRDRVPQRYALRPVHSDYWGGHVESLLVELTVCPTCGGSGRYVGLQVIEACDACEGAGAVPVRE